jgi:type IV pilus assembly protein PilA
MRQSQKGFTLIELLVVIAIIAILATVVFVALDPVTRFADARNSYRWNDVNSILTAVHQYIVDNNGALPAGLTTTESQLGTATSGCTAATGGCNVAADTDCTDLSTPLATYLKSIPVGPNGTADLTGYSIVADANNIITVTACGAENGETIQVSR